MNSEVVRDYWNTYCSKRREKIGSIMKTGLTLMSMTLSDTNTKNSQTSTTNLDRIKKEESVHRPKNKLFPSHLSISLWLITMKWSESWRKNLGFNYSWIERRQEKGLVSFLNSQVNWIDFFLLTSPSMSCLGKYIVNGKTGAEGSNHPEFSLSVLNCPFSSVTLNGNFQIQCHFLAWQWSFSPSSNDMEFL